LTTTLRRGEGSYGVAFLRRWPDTSRAHHIQRGGHGRKRTKRFTFDFPQSVEEIRGRKRISLQNWWVNARASSDDPAWGKKEKKDRRGLQVL